MDVVDIIYSSLLCKSEIDVHGGHNRICKTLATFSHGRLLLFAKCKCKLFIVWGGLAVIFRHGHRMVSSHWITGKSFTVVYG